MTIGDWLRVILYIAVPLVLIWAARRRQASVRSAEGASAPEGYADLLPAECRQKNGRQVLYFWGAHCSACKLHRKRIDALASAHDNLCKIDVAEHADLTQLFGVRGLPTFVVLEQGVIQEIRLGITDDEHIRRMLVAG